jgi:RNA polymerase sigma-70 factor (ECF subfamily)
VVARHRALDRLRRERRRAEKEALLLDRAPAQPLDPDPADDDLLQLLFACCHPSLSPEARVALTLRAVAGFTPREVARAFLVSESAVVQRLARARRKVRDARIPFRTPPPEELPLRLTAVLAVVYLVFTEGYATTAADTLVRRELCAEAIRLGRLLARLMPREPEVLGLLALMLLQDSRREASTDRAGRLVLLEDQDRSRWDREEIREGLEVLERSLRLGGPGPYQLQAAIAAVHARVERAEDTDWSSILGLYDELARVAPSPVVELNRAVAVGMVEGPRAGLRALERAAHRGKLDRYRLLHAARADLLRRLGRLGEAAAAYRAALELATNPAERAFLRARLAEVEGHALADGILEPW